MLAQPAAAVRAPFRAQFSGQRLTGVPAAGRGRAPRLSARAEGKVTREYNEGDGKVSDGKKPLYADEAPVRTCCNPQQMAADAVQLQYVHDRILP